MLEFTRDIQVEIAQRVQTWAFQQNIYISTHITQYMP